MTTPETVPRPAPLTDLIAAWAQAMSDVRSLADELGEPGWRRPSLLPGWTVGDVVAHLSWIERIMLGRADPPHQPEWAALPHATSDFGRATEVPVDLRRSWPRERVLAEFDATIADRHAALRAGPQDLDTPARDPFGRPSTLEGVLRMRTFDTWVHGQDIRLAVGRPGATDTDAARIAAEQIAGALGFVWAKKVVAPVGATLVLDVRGPDWWLRRAVIRQADGKGVAIAPPEQPTVAVSMSFEDFVQLGCGRSRPDRGLDAAAADVLVDGDQALAERTIRSLAITP